VVERQDLDLPLWVTRRRMDRKGSRPVSRHQDRLRCDQMKAVNYCKRLLEETDYTLECRFRKQMVRGYG
jgi:hypothetical protein